MTRHMIDARSTPVVITTLPARENGVAVRAGREIVHVTPAAPLTLPAPRANPWPRRGIIAGSIVFLSTGPAGFVVGFLGYGLTTLYRIAVAGVVLAAGYVALSFVGGGGSGPHCPGPWHK